MIWKAVVTLSSLSGRRPACRLSRYPNGDGLCHLDYFVCNGDADGDLLLLRPEVAGAEFAVADVLEPSDRSLSQ